MPQTEKNQKERTRLVQGKRRLRRGQGHLVTETENTVLGRGKFEKLIETQEKTSQKEVAVWVWG